MANYYAHASEVMKQCKTLGLDVPVVGTEGVDSWQFLETAGKNADGLYLTTNMDRDTKDENTQKFMKDYRATYNKEPDMSELPRTMPSRLSLKRLKKRVLPSRLPLKIK